MMRYYVPPSKEDPCFELHDNYETWIREDADEKENIDNMLKWIMSNREEFQADPTDCKLTSLNVDFVCKRGLLARALRAPYENDEDLVIAVTKFRGTYFMCELETEIHAEYEAALIPDTRADRQCYGGYKFEKYVTAETAGGEPDNEKPVNNNEHFDTVVRAKIGSHSLVYGGEVDAYDPGMEGDSKYVELKTCYLMNFEDERVLTKFKRTKLLSSWAQSVTVAVDKIVFGFRDENNVIHRLTDFQTSQIPDLVAEIKQPWRPEVCFHFLQELLGLIKSRITVANHHSVYVVAWAPREKPFHQAHRDPIRFVEFERQGRNSEHAFLPPWFVDWEGWRTGN